MRNVTKNQLSENSNLNYAQQWLSRVFPSICYRYYNALLLFILSAEQITITSYTMVIIHIRKLIGGLKLCWTIPKPMRSQNLIEFSCMFFCEINELQIFGNAFSISKYSECRRIVLNCLTMNFKYLMGRHDCVSKPKYNAISKHLLFTYALASFLYLFKTAKYLHTNRNWNSNMDSNNWETTKTNDHKFYR